MYSDSFYFLIVFISFSSWTFANVEFVTEPPKEVETFPGQTVALPCVFSNLIPSHHIVQWDVCDKKIIIIISNNRVLFLNNLINAAQNYSIIGDEMNFTLIIEIPDSSSLDFGTSTNISTYYRCSVFDPNKKEILILTGPSTVTIQKKEKNPVSNNQNDSISILIIVVSVTSCVVIIFVFLLICFLRRKRNQHKDESTRKNKAELKRQTLPKIKNEDPKGLVYDYATINVNEFKAEYLEAENEIYVGGDGVSNDETNTANKKVSYQKLEDQYGNNVNEIYDEPTNTREPDSKIKEIRDEKHVYSQVNKPKYKECENEIYQGPEL